MRLSEEQARVILSALQHAVPADYGYYVILCPRDLDRSKILAIGNLSLELVPELLRGMADSAEAGPPTKLPTS